MNVPRAMIHVGHMWNCRPTSVDKMAWKGEDGREIRYRKLRRHKGRMVVEYEIIKEKGARPMVLFSEGG